MPDRATCHELLEAWLDALVANERACQVHDRPQMDAQFLAARRASDELRDAVRGAAIAEAGFAGAPASEFLAHQSRHHWDKAVRRTEHVAGRIGDPPIAVTLERDPDTGEERAVQ